MEEQIKSEIIAQSLSEIAFARQYKQGKIKNWQKNEEMYYGVKRATTESRANVDLARMQEFVHTLLSKVDNPLVFKFLKRKEAQLKRVQRLNALRESDQKTDFWDIKDLVGKKQGIIYGRAVFAYYADSVDGYKAHLENTDVYDFLIDPSAGGVDIENGRYMGRFGIVKDRYEIEEGIKSGRYLKEAENLINGSGNNTERNQEEQNKSVRTYGQGTQQDKELQDKDKFKFWDWFTTYKGNRYHLILEESGTALVVELLTEIFASDLWPFWTWAAFPDLTEFWTPSYCDYARELFMAQNVSVNQMLDNAEAINKPMKGVDLGAIENLAELKYRKDGIVRFKSGTDVNRAYQIFQTPSINTPIAVFNLLENIQEKSSGVTSGSKGVSDETGKVGIYEGNQEAAADRFGLLNKSYSFGYQRFAKLYEAGVREHLTRKVAIDILGPNGIETEEVKRSDLFRKGDDYAVLVEASNAENATSIQTQRAKLNFLNAHIQDPIQNPKKAYEIGAKIAGFEQEEIKQLQEKDYGNQELLSEAERDIESLIEGEDIKVNQAANNAYKQRMVDYLRDHMENMKQETIARMIFYIQSLDEVIYINEARALNKFELDKMNAMATQPLQGVGGEAPQLNLNNPQEGENLNVEL